eukprot:1126736-Pyramimonas_sp.AAC.1
MNFENLEPPAYFGLGHQIVYSRVGPKSFSRPFTELPTPGIGVDIRQRETTGGHSPASPKPK